MYKLTIQSNTDNNVFLQLYKDSKDGIMVWHKWNEHYMNRGSEQLHIEHLERELLKPYPKEQPYSGGVPQFVDDFQSKFNELEGLYARQKKRGHDVPVYIDSQKKRLLLTALHSVMEIHSLVQQL